MTPPTESPANITRQKLRVRFGDTDLMGIAHHARYLSYFEEGRVEYIRRRGVPYQEWIERGLHLPVVDAQLSYKASARFDDVLTVDTWIGELGRASLRFEYRIERAGEESAQLLCTGSTKLACVDDQLRVRRLPPDVVALLCAPEGGGN